MNSLHTLLAIRASVVYLYIVIILIKVIKSFRRGSNVASADYFRPLFAQPLKDGRTPYLFPRGAVCESDCIDVV